MCSVRCAFVHTRWLFVLVVRLVRSYQENVMLKQFKRLLMMKKRLLLLRTGHNVVDICTFHRKMYLQHYSWTPPPPQKKKCCDPLGHHPTKAVTRSLRVITETMAKRWSTDEVTLVQVMYHLSEKPVPSI